MSSEAPASAPRWKKTSEISTALRSARPHWAPFASDADTGGDAMALTNLTERFHSLLDKETARASARTVDTKEHKYFIIQERDVHYQFSLHQHPYVQQLMQRLLRMSTSGLQ